MLAGVLALTQAPAALRVCFCSPISLAAEVSASYSCTPLRHWPAALWQYWDWMWLPRPCFPAMTQTPAWCYSPARWAGPAGGGGGQVRGRQEGSFSWPPHSHHPPTQGDTRVFLYELLPEAPFFLECNSFTSPDPHKVSLGALPGVSLLWGGSPPSPGQRNGSLREASPRSLPW